jgi:hypothetical protein
LRETKFFPFSRQDAKAQRKSSKILVAYLLAALVVVPASACPNVRDSSKWKNSDVVVNGVARCETVDGRCLIKVERILKGRKFLRSSGNEISASVRVQDPENFYCGIEWVLDEDGSYRGRFYIDRNEQNSFTLAYWPNAKKVD